MVTIIDLMMTGVGGGDRFFIGEGFPPERRMSEFDLFSDVLRIHLYQFYFIWNGQIVCGFIISAGMEGTSWKPTKTIPNNDFEQAIKEMDSHQIDINMVQISLLALTNEQILKWVLSQMHKYEFYLKYRYLLPNVLNGKMKPQKKQQVDLILTKFDERFINGEQSLDYSEKALMMMPFQKQQRLRFVQDKETIIKKLDQLSGELFTIQDPDDKRQYFEEQIAYINDVLQGKDQEDESTSEEETPTTNTLKGFIFCQQDSLRKLVNINLKTSFFIQTKNRNPLVLDFEFAPFLYKNDDQLAHEIIAMQYIKYFNTILGKQYIIPYEIRPEQIGALYEFIEDATTIHKIKQNHQDGLISYFNQLQEKGKAEQQILNRFAQTYSGFCLIQYMLDIKDRNNCNIMVKQDGSIFHIDLAFIFGAGPGSISFQSAPFKMTKEYIKVLGGFDSDYFKKFEALLVQHFTKILEIKKQLMMKINILAHRKKQIRCFKDYDSKTFQKKFPRSQAKVKQFVENLIDESYDNWRTIKYDDFQFKSNDILK